MESNVKILRNFQMTIPKDVRILMNLHVGDWVHVSFTKINMADMEKSVKNTDVGQPAHVENTEKVENKQDTEITKVTIQSKAPETDPKSGIFASYIETPAVEWLEKAGAVDFQNAISYPKFVSRLLAMFRKDDVEATLAQMRSEGEIVVDHDKIFLIKEEIN